MTAVAVQQPCQPSDLRVELLRDAKGIYGIGAVGSSEAEDHEVSELPDFLEEDEIARTEDTKLIVRPDRVAETSHSWGSGAIYQRVPCMSLRSKLFRHSCERSLVRQLHHAMWERAGGMRATSYRDQAEAADKFWQENRKQWHGLKRLAHCTVNQLIGRMLEEAADMDAVRAVRRYPAAYRQDLYESFVANGARALQLAHSFPALALLIYSTHAREEWTRNGTVKAENDAAKVAAEMVRRGIGTREIAGAFDLPIAFKKFQPGAARIAIRARKAFTQDTDLIHAYMPDKLPKMRHWAHSVACAEEMGPPFVKWTARHCLSIGETTDDALHVLSDLKDWVRASYRASIPDFVWRVAGGQSGGGGGAEFVTRPFSADMSLHTVFALSDEWHSAVAERGEVPGGTYEFPSPWYPGAEVQSYSIEPIETAAALYQEGKAMHHCISTYAEAVAISDVYVYSVRKAEKRVATAELVRANDRIALGQIRGRCNSKTTASVTRAVRAWVRQSKRLHGDIAPSLPQRNVTPLFAGGGFDDDLAIPF